MRKAILVILLSGSALLSACGHYYVPKGNPGEDPNVDKCFPGHESTYHCHGR